ncbi:MAG: hypothetical protein O7B81_13980 [Gammaproteobacteria bacterium]|nr:hypothetical protein [Gammaproteobacteria bacterium]MCZ6895336.1 hypothetical protein [Gammaproteobacteria bacterium]
MALMTTTGQALFILIVASNGIINTLVKTLFFTSLLGGPALAYAAQGMFLRGNLVATPDASFEDPFRDSPHGQLAEARDAVPKAMLDHR